MLSPLADAEAGMSILDEDFQGSVDEEVQSLCETASQGDDGPVYQLNDPPSPKPGPAKLML